MHATCHGKTLNQPGNAYLTHTMRSDVRPDNEDLCWVLGHTQRETFFFSPDRVTVTTDKARQPFDASGKKEYVDESWGFFFF